MKKTLTAILATALFNTFSFGTTPEVISEATYTARSNLTEARAVLDNLDNPNSVGFEVYVDNGQGIIDGQALFVFKSTRENRKYAHPYWKKNPMDRGDGPSKNSNLPYYKAFKLNMEQESLANEAVKTPEAWLEFLQAFKAEKEPLLTQEITTLEQALADLNNLK